MNTDGNIPSVTVQDDVLSAFNEFRMTGAAKTDKPKFIILKIAENKKEVVLEDMSPEKNYEVFREKLESARDDKGNPAPRYAVYNVEYELPGEGHRYA